MRTTSKINVNARKVYFGAIRVNNLRHESAHLCSFTAFELIVVCSMRNKNAERKLLKQFWVCRICESISKHNKANFVLMSILRCRHRRSLARSTHIRTEILICKREREKTARKLQFKILYFG